MERFSTNNTIASNVFHSSPRIVFYLPSAPRRCQAHGGFEILVDVGRFYYLEPREISIRLTLSCLFFVYLSTSFFLSPLVPSPFSRIVLQRFLHFRSRTIRPYRSFYCALVIYLRHFKTRGTDISLGSSVFYRVYSLVCFLKFSSTIATLDLVCSPVPFSLIGEKDRSIGRCFSFN